MTDVSITTQIMNKCVFTFMIMTMFYTTGESLKCFECDNKFNPACGVEFKTYQYKAKPCKSQHAKCGLQRQQRIGDFIGIIRRCHILGSVENLNETDGCHKYVAPPHNHTFQICLCSENYCNNANARTSLSMLTFVSACFIPFLVLYMCNISFS